MYANRFLTKWQKRMAAWLLTLTLAAALVPMGGLLQSLAYNGYGAPYGTDQGANGTPGNPYIISIAEELAGMASKPMSSSFMLVDDIDLTDFGDWTPLAAFQGEFDGRGYTISGMKCTPAAGETGGLFSYLNGGGTIKNLRVEGEVTVNNANGGGIVATASGNAHIINCSFTGKITGTGLNNSTHLGGIAGQFLVYNPAGEKASMLNCFADVSIVAASSGGSPLIGGLAGNTYCRGESLSIKNCYAKGAITISGSGSPGVAGLCGQGGGWNDSIPGNPPASVGETTAYKLENCYSNVKLTNTLTSGTRGGLMSRNDVSGSGKLGFHWPATAATSYFNNEIWTVNARTGTVSGPTALMDAFVAKNIPQGRTATQLKQKTTFAGWDFDLDWDFRAGENDGFPVPRSNDTWEVSFDTDSASEIQTVFNGQSAKIPPPPIRDDYTFIEWRYNGAAYDFSTPIYEDITLVAEWLHNSLVTTPPPTPTPTEPPDVIKTMKTRYYDYLCGGETAHGATDPDILANIDYLDAAVDGYIDSITLPIPPAQTFIFPGYTNDWKGFNGTSADGLYLSSAMTRTFARLATMATCHETQGSKYYKDEGIREKILAC
ncbi:MAG: InlB B-repeat-containing protein, partial [Clostridia bacterium]|nr:InlB B-repeat-containing protein [Clostridia bacterium]